MMDLSWFYRQWQVNQQRRIEQLPQWLEQNGLVFWDDFTTFRPRALTGQQYTWRTPTEAQPNDPITFPILGGKRCMYKEGAYNYFHTDLQMASSSWTFSVWCYDNLGTCNNQQVANLNTSAGSIMFNHHATNGKHRLAIWANNASTYIVDDGAAPVGTWTHYLARQYTQGWELWINGVKIGSTTRSRNYDTTLLRFLHTNCFGVAIRCAAFYNRALTTDEIADLYSNSADWLASRLPTGYMDYAFIKCDGASGHVLDTGLTMAKGTWWEVTAAMDASKTSTAPIGTGVSKTDDNFAMWLHKDSSRQWVEAVYGNGNSANYIYNYDLTTTEPHTYRQDTRNGRLYVDGQYVGHSTNRDYSITGRKIIIAGCWRGSAIQDVFKGYLGECRIINDYNTVLRHYVPCKRLSDNAVGMYDLVNDTFTALTGSSVTDTLS